MGEWIYSSTCT